MHPVCRVHICFMYLQVTSLNTHTKEKQEEQRFEKTDDPSWNSVSEWTTTSSYFWHRSSTHISVPPHGRFGGGGGGSNGWLVRALSQRQDTI